MIRFEIYIVVCADLRMFYNLELARFFLKKELSWLKNEQWIVVKKTLNCKTVFEKKKRELPRNFYGDHQRSAKISSHLHLSVVASENLTVTKNSVWTVDVANKFHSSPPVQNLNFKSFKLLWYHLLRRFRTWKVTSIENSQWFWSVHTQEWVCPSSNHIHSVVSCW